MVFFFHYAGIINRLTLGLLKREGIILKKSSAIFLVGFMVLFTILAGCSPKVEETKTKTNSAANSDSGDSSGKEYF